MDTVSYERWPEVERWLLAASDVPAAARAAFLDRACPEALREVVRALLDDLDEPDAACDMLLVPDLVQELVEAAPPEGAEAARLPLERVGTYVLERYLGNGGMGNVYLGRSVVYPEAPPVAVKLLRRDLYGEEVERRFRRERIILATLRHPNIAAFLDAGSTREGWPYFAMEYVDGTDVLTYAREQGLDAAARLDLFEKVCAPIAHAHAQRIVHCDIKPDNLFVDREGTVKVLDFGIAKVLRPLVSTETPDSYLFLSQPCDDAYSPLYAAPEQHTLGAKVLSAEADVYALGVVGAELLRDASAPAACEAVWRRARAQEPANRYPSASALLEAIRSARSSGAVKVQSPKSQLPGASGSSLR